MKQFILFTWSTAVCLVMVLFSCAEESQVGYGLVGDDELAVEFSDDFVLTTQTLKNDSVPVVADQSFTNSYFLGSVLDTEFGGLSSQVFMNSFINDGIIPDYARGAFDSLVLTLAIDSSFRLGNPNASHTITVYELEELIPTDTVFSNQIFQANLVDVLGRKENVVPSAIDTVRIPDLITDSTTTALLDVVRIPMSRRLGRTLFQDTSIHENADRLRTKFAGLHITSDAIDGMFAISQASFLTLYYHDEDGNYEGYNYIFSQTFSNYSRNYSSSAVERVFDQPTSEDQRIYLQGLAGPNAVINLGDIGKLGNVIINHATLEFTLDQLATRDTTFFPTPMAVTLTKLAEDGQQIIDDVNLTTFFGGIRSYDENIERFTYEMNVTSHLVGILNGDEPEDVYLRVTEDIRNPASAILYGPNHPEFPVKLKVTYTKL